MQGMEKGFFVLLQSFAFPSALLSPQPFVSERRVRP